MREAQFLIPDKKTLYDTMQRNGYVLPPAKDPLMTIKFMKGVKAGFFFCLKQDMMQNFKQCATPPPRQQMSEILHYVMTNTTSGLGEQVDIAMKRTAQEVLLKRPNVAWQLQMLAQFNPDNELFDKSYVYQRARKSAALVPEMRVSNEDGFFSGLPIASAGGKRKRRGIDFTSEADKKKAKIDLLEEKLNAMKMQISKEYVKWNESKTQSHFYSQQRSQRVDLESSVRQPVEEEKQLLSASQVHLKSPVASGLADNFVVNQSSIAVN